MNKGFSWWWGISRFNLLFIFFCALLNINHSSAQIRINEILTVNASVNYDPQFFNYPSWIELYNTGSTQVNIGGYYLTDSKLNKTKWAVPTGTYIAANGYLLVWCDNENTGLHTNFRLDSDGENIFIYNGSQILLDSITLPKQYTNTSYGRISNGTSWGYFLTPSPLSANSASEISGLLLPPAFSLPSGRYNSSVTISLSSAYPSGIQIRYTTDGTEPTQLSSLYSTPISVSQTTVIKAKVYSPYCIPSETVTKTYFINEHVFTLPVFSISLNPPFLWDNTIGMHVAGTNGIGGNCAEAPKNYNRDWARYGVVEMFDKTGDSQFKKDFDIKIYGACSRHYFDQKSLAFYARGEYGKGHLEQKLFETKDLDRFDALILRNSGNDFNVTMFRDALMQSIIAGKLNVDWQAYQPAAVYLNNTYWGIMNIREKLDKDYIEHNGKVDKDSIDFLENTARTTTSIIEGSIVHYNTFLKSLGTMNLSTKSTYDYIDSQIDIENYIHYYITQIYYANTDWPGNNIKFWRPAKQGGKWRWMIFDTDFGFSNATHATLNFVTDSTTVVDWPNPQNSTILFRRLIKNPYFRQRFIQTFSASIHSVFKPERVNKIIDSIAGLIATEMVYHKQKYGGSISDWNSKVQELKTFASQRYNYMPTHITQFFNISSPLASLNASIKQPKTGEVLVNGVRMNKSESVKLYCSIPYQISAVPDDGYRFKQWQIINSQSGSLNLINKGEVWKYSDKGSNLGLSWSLSTYNDMSWTTGQAELGYGDGDEKTVVSYGSNASNKYITTYFRKTVSLADTNNIKTANINMICDDGAVIYVNGVEAARYNMPAGQILYNTLASTYSPEGVTIDLSVNPKLLRPGNNTIAVEIHQNSATSTDISFDMDLKLIKTVQGSESISPEINITDTLENDITYIAEFEPVNPVENLYINEISAKKSILTDNYGNSDDWFEIYNANQDTIELAGLFLSDNFSNPDKFKILRNSSGNTKVAPNSHIVFWADEEAHQGNKHCTFKLSGDGERIGIFQIVGTDTLAIDTITYGAQMDFMSYGRYPDAAVNYVFMPTMTPSSTNIYNLVSINSQDTKNRDVKLYPNPVSGSITIAGLPLQGADHSFIIADGMGKVVLQGKLINNKIACSKLPSGIYFITITKGQDLWKKKFIKL